MRRAIAGALVVTALGCGGAPARPIRLGAPEIYEARVLAARGPVLPRPGDACTVEIARTDDAYYNCRIRVECAGDMLYGLADSGYNACYAEGTQFVFARDRNGTRQDGDPRLYFDLAGGRVFVSDDSPDVEIEIDLSGVPERYEEGAPADLQPG
jgi:hypothetical protein